MTIEGAIFAGLWLIFAASATALFAVLLIRSDARRIARRRRQERPAE